MDMHADLSYFEKSEVISPLFIHISYKKLRKCQTKGFHGEGQCNFGQERELKESIPGLDLGILANRMSISAVLQGIRWG
jgi:hypothetical protein